MEQTLNRSQHIKLTLEKKNILPLLPGFEFATFRLWVWCSNQQAILAYTLDLRKLEWAEYTTVQAGNEWLNILQKFSQARKKPPPLSFLLLLFYFNDSEQQAEMHAAEDGQVSKACRSFVGPLLTKTVLFSSGEWHAPAGGVHAAGSGQDRVSQFCRPLGRGVWQPEAQPGFRGQPLQQLSGPGQAWGRRGDGHEGGVTRREEWVISSIP